MSRLCSTCKTDKPVGDFVGKNERDLKTCSTCRDGVKAYKQNNKDRIKDNNAFQSSKRVQARAIERAKKPRLLARPVDSNGEWQIFATQIELTTAIGAQAANVSRVLSGKATQTAKHNIRYETEEELNAHVNRTVAEAKKQSMTDWKDYQKQTGRVYEHAPSKFRKPHTMVDNIEGKECSSCKEWKPLTGYNYSATHWDNHRHECKECLHTYRVNNIDKIRDYNIEYWKKTKDAQTDAHRKWKENNREHVNAYARMRRITYANVRISDNIRSRLRKAIRGHTKSSSTFEYVGMDCAQYMDWLEFQFYDGMEWANYGKHWHIDHMIPCANFVLENEDDKTQCFGWWNTRPLVARKNLSKSDQLPGKMDLVLQELKAVFFAQNFM
jgi:hypothetical protein